MTERATPTLPEGDATPHRSRMPAVAIWVSIVALAACAVLLLPYRAQASLVVVPVFALAAAAGLAGIILGVRARRSAAARGGWALICALVSLLIGVVLAVIFAIGLIAASSITKVELLGQGPEGMSATLSHDTEDRTEAWPAEGWAEFNTKGSWAELTLEAPEDAASQRVSCQIVWNGEIVVDETSDHGMVTCRYDAG